MNAVFDMLSGKLDKAELNQLGQQIGADEALTRQGLSAALPLLLQALNRNASDPSGAQALHDALSSDHDGSLLDDIGGYLANPEQGNGAGILRHVLGEKRAELEGRLAGGTGLNQDSISRLLEIAAPLVLAVLGREQRRGSFSTIDLTDFLSRQQRRAQEHEPGLLGMLTGWLDANDDGSVMDDIQRIAGRWFGSAG
jgi:hypothetical protein